MSTIRHLLATSLVLGSQCLMPGTARAAQSYDNCAGFIDSLPATINTQGVWCLRHDLATSMTSGNAINITANNVTIDCNEFKIGGLGAGNASATRGIYAGTRQNTAVRHCNVRGFYIGIYLDGSGHLVEDNRLDNSLYVGIVVTGDNNRVQRNRVYDTGGYPGLSTSCGICASADVIDNTVAGVYATAANTSPIGVQLSGTGTEMRGNQVRGLVPAGTGAGAGIFVLGIAARIADNHVSAGLATAGTGINAVGADTFCTGNTVVNFGTAYNSCEHIFGNLP